MWDVLVRVWLCGRKIGYNQLFCVMLSKRKIACRKRSIHLSTINNHWRTTLCMYVRNGLLEYFFLYQILFLFHKKKKNISWDADSLSHWTHVSTHSIHVSYSRKIVYYFLVNNWQNKKISIKVSLKPSSQYDTIQYVVTYVHVAATLYNVWYSLYVSQDSTRDCVSLTLSNNDGGSEVLNLTLPEYSGVLLDCLQGEYTQTINNLW